MIRRTLEKSSQSNISTYPLTSHGLWKPYQNTFKKSVKFSHKWVEHKAISHNTCLKELDCGASQQCMSDSLLYILNVLIWLMSKTKLFQQFPWSTQKSKNRKGSACPVWVAWFMPSPPIEPLCPHSLWFCRLPLCSFFRWVSSKSLIKISRNSFVSCSDHNLLILPRCHAKCSGAAGTVTTAHDSASRTEELGLWPQRLCQH